MGNYRYCLWRSKKPVCRPMLADLLLLLVLSLAAMRAAAAAKTVEEEPLDAGSGAFNPDDEDLAAEGSGGVPPPVNTASDVKRTPSAPALPVAPSDPTAAVDATHHHHIHDKHPSLADDGGEVEDFTSTYIIVGIVTVILLLAITIIVLTCCCTRRESTICDACLSAYVGVPFRAAAARNRALGAATNAHDERARAAQCQRITPFGGAYRADELRQLATTYRFVGDEYSPFRRLYTCTFDSVDEPCAWYLAESPPHPDGGRVGDNSVEASAHRRENFVRRARFETLFDYNRFDCTNDRGFPFSEHFLMIGADESGTMEDESSVALEARLPCQHQNAILKFDGLENGSCISSYWSINETPVLKVCVLLESNHFPQCQESRLDANPLTFEIPRSEAAFRLRIQVDHLGADDVVLIDNLQYSPPPPANATACWDRSRVPLSPTTTSTSVGRFPLLIASNNDLFAATTTTTMFPLLAALLSPTPSPSSTFSLFPTTALSQQQQPQRRRLTSSPLLSSDFRPSTFSFVTEAPAEAAVSAPMSDANGSDDRPLGGEAFGGGNGGVRKKFPSTAELVDENWEQTDSRRLPAPPPNDVREEADKEVGEDDASRSSGVDGVPSTQWLSACQALTCDFNTGDACFYTRSGSSGTAEWQIGSGAVGNPHTGIHRPNPRDVSNRRSSGGGGGGSSADSFKMSPFAYVGVDANDLYGEVFVLESSRFRLSPRDEPVAFLLFDLFQRSVGPLLKVCINDFTDCPYSNPVLATRHHWHLDQRIPLNASSEVVYFIAGRLRQNQFLAIDNIRLEDADGEELRCD